MRRHTEVPDDDDRPDPNRAAVTAHGPWPARPAKRLTVYTGVRHRVHHRPLAVELMRRARHAGMAGATVFQAQSGYGHSGRMHRVHLVVEDAPETVVVVDRPERIDAFVEEVADLLDGMLVVVDDVEIVEC